MNEARSVLTTMQMRLNTSSPTIQHLIHLDLVDTCISDVVRARIGGIAHAPNLVSLTLHGTPLTSLQLPQPSLAQITYSRILEQVPAQEQRSCRIRQCTCSYCTLKAFHFALVGHDDNLALSNSIVQFFSRTPSLAPTQSGNFHGSSCADELEPQRKGFGLMTQHRQCGQWKGFSTVSCVHVSGTSFDSTNYENTRMPVRVRHSVKGVRVLLSCTRAPEQKQLAEGEKYAWRRSRKRTNNSTRSWMMRRRLRRCW